MSTDVASHGPGGAAGSARSGAVIHDIRYSRFTGELRPRGYAVLALAKSSALRAVGIRRTAGAKVWPFVLVMAAYLPAVVAVSVPLVFGGEGSPLEVIGYWDLLGVINLILVAYGATTLPSLLTRERRERVLSLYFATALSPVEYVAGKVLAALGLLLLVVLGPLLVLFVGGILVAPSPLEWTGDHVGDLPGIVAAALVLATHHAALGLALGSLTPRRVFAVGGYLAVMLVTPVVGGLLYFVGGEHRSVLLVDMLTLPLAPALGLLDEPLPDMSSEPIPPVGAAWALWALIVVVGLSLVMARYRSGRDA
jgi:ABC-2 type transport system permease protein